ncbi:hypothetical protein FO524_31535, partial [Bacillus mycoides]
MSVSDTELNENEIEFCFNPQMITIIGGRGTGKSSLFRFVRGVFQKINDLRGLSNLAEEQENFFRIKQNDEGLLKKESVLEIIVVRFGKEYKIHMSNFSRQGPQNVKIYEYDQTLEEFM